MLDEKREVIRKIGIHNVSQDHAGSRISKRPPIEAALIPSNDERPYKRRDPKQWKQTVCPNKREHQRQEPYVFTLEQKVNACDRDYYRQRRGFCHTHPVIEHVGTGKYCGEPDQRVIDLVSMDQPVGRKYRECGEHDRRDLCGHHRLKKP